MTPAVDSEMAALAGCDDVVGVCAWGVAVAEVGHGEADGSFGEVGGLVVFLQAAAGAVESAEAEALTAEGGAFVSDEAGELFPVEAVSCEVAGHQATSIHEGSEKTPVFRLRKR
jgi:hypothetical protein